MVLVTGASGFVGGHVARALVRSGASVRALLRPSSVTSAIEDILKQLEIVHGDLTNPGSLRAACKSCTQVYHAAADYRLWTRDPQAMYKSNVGGTENLLDAAANAGVY